MCIYFRDERDYYKVGIAVNVSKRMASIQTSNPDRIRLVCCRLVEDAEQVERKIHEYLTMHRSNGGGEWFKLTHEQAVEVACLLNTMPKVKMLDKMLTVQMLIAQNRRDLQQIKEWLFSFTRSIAWRS
jgi:hypothetical protein